MHNLHFAVDVWVFSHFCYPFMPAGPDVIIVDRFAHVINHEFVSEK